MAMIIAKMTPLDRILPNPWQPRESEDAEHIKSLALDIAAHGLLQKPVGRIVNGDGLPVGEWNGSFDGEWSVQLAFGHSRLAAYKLCNWTCQELCRRVYTTFEDGLIGLAESMVGRDDDFGTMPVIIQELSDEQMCEMAISENLQRRDLTPIEVAKAMARYRSEFGKTSAEIGALFGLSDSAVRNKMRLVELPEAAQDALESGKITEHAARRLLGLKDTLKPEAVGEIAQELATRQFEKPEMVDRYIGDKVRNAKRTQRLFYAHKADEKQVEDLWPLDWTTGALWQAEYDWFRLNPASVGQMLPTPEDWRELRSNIETVCHHFAVAGIKPDALANAKRDGDPDVYAAVAHLYNPPACQDCKFFMRIAGDGYCTRRACYEIKREIWIQKELERLSAELGIAIYKPAVDGEVFEALSSYGSPLRSDIIKKKAAGDKSHLRLNAIKEHGSWWYEFPITKHKFIQVISISEESQAYVLQAKTEKERREAVDQQERRDRERGWEMQKRSQKFMEAVAAPEFGAFMFTLKPGILAVLFRVWARTSLPDDLDGNQKNNVMRAALGYQVLERLVQRELEFQGPVAVAEYLQGVAAEIGLFLPENWMDMAREIENGVSVETEVTA